jgi:arylsulfatase A-like enzyme
VSAPTDSRNRPRFARLGAFALVLLVVAAVAACGSTDDSGGSKGKDGKAAGSKPEPMPVPAKDRRLPGFPAAPKPRSKRELRESERAAAAAKASGQRPNFIQIWTDDQTIDSMKYMPRLQRVLRDKGTTFSQYHDVQPLCCPSRATYLSGQYPHNHHVYSNKPPNGGFGAMDFNDTFYTALDDAGYRTGYIGKVLNVAPGTNLAVRPEPGFDDWFAELIQPKDQMRTYRLSDNGHVLKVKNGRFQNDLFAKKTRQFLKQKSKQPFMLTVSVFTPHWSPCQGERGKRRSCPPIPAQQDRKKFPNARFPGGPNYMPGDDAAFMERYWRRELQSLQSVDRMLAATVKQLKRQGELDNTYVIFQTDNGLLHGEHALFGKNYPWDRSVRVPLVIRGPGFPAGVNRADLTANVDVPATILDAAGVKPPRVYDGYSLLSDHERKSLLMERLEGSKKPGRGTWRQIKTADGYTYWEYGDGGHQRLYDLNKDPYQLRNLVRKKPKLVERLQHEIDRVEDCAGDCP